MKFNITLQVFVFVLLLLPEVIFAAANAFTPLVGVPGISGEGTNFNTYINTLYALSISIAALIAVIKIIVAGVKYMLTDIVTSKEEAKGDIRGALIGLLIVISAVVILNQINPQLTKSDLFLAPASQSIGNGPSTTAVPPPSPPSGVPLLENCSPGADC